MYNIHYDICAIFVLLAELVMFYAKKNIRTGHNKIYIWMIYALLISTACDFAAGIIGNSTAACPMVFALIINNVYFVSHVALPMMFALYNILTNVKINRYKLWMKILFYVPYGVAMAALILNVFNGMLV